MKSINEKKKMHKFQSNWFNFNNEKKKFLPLRHHALCIAVKHRIHVFNALATYMQQYILFHCLWHTVLVLQNESIVSVIVVAVVTGVVCVCV